MWITGLVHSVVEYMLLLDSCCQIWWRTLLLLLDKKSRFSCESLKQTKVSKKDNLALRGNDRDSNASKIFVVGFSTLV
jgi:hypothetical protein